MLTDPGRVPIGRRAWLGDGRRGASLAPDGTIDWYCAGGLTARPDLWRLLDESGPAIRVGPVREGSGVRRHLPASRMAYREGTNVVETVSEGPGGRRVALLDFMPWDGSGGILRLVRALSGPVDVEVEVLSGPDRRPGGGRREVIRTGSGLLVDGLAVTAPVPFEPAPVDRDTARWRAVLRLDAGQEELVTIGLEDPIGPATARRILEDTETAARSWLALLAASGPFRGSVARSLLSVRALTGPGGAPAAAGTSSLPRRVGSERSSDERWVHLRDVATATRVLAEAGLAEDALAAETWLRLTLEAADRPWAAWFDPDGQPVPGEEEWPLAGWRRSQPVTGGRRAALDVGLAGAVTAAIGASTKGPGGRADDPGALSAAFAALAEQVDWAADHWADPDHGRWEIERPTRLYVAGRIELWSALGRMARQARAANPLDLRAAGWQQEGRDVLSWIDANCTAGDGGLRMDGAPAGSDEPDAALLAVAWDGPWPPTHPVVGATVDRVLERLSSDLLLHRYSDRVADELAGPDLPDLEASLLAVRALALLGRWDEAHERMEAVTGLVAAAGPGLLASTADPVTGELYGNFPSTAASLALVDAARSLEAGPA